MKILALIPARGGSKGLPRKNVRPIAGKPLVAHSIEQGLASRYIERVIVSTDDEEIAAVARQFGAEAPFMRPAEYATDTALDLDVFRHCLLWLQQHEGAVPDLIVQLRPTAPVRRVETLDLAIERMMAAPQADSLRSVSVAPLTPYKMWSLDENLVLRPIMESPGIADWYDQPRQKLPVVYVQNGFVDIVRASTVLQKNSMAGDTILSFTHTDPVVDIDDQTSLRRAEQCMLQLQQRDRPAQPAQPLRIGILQGRLTAVPPGTLQAFPGQRWADEFGVAMQLGLDAIELLAEREHNPVNPIWSSAGRQALRSAADSTGVRLASVCVDYVLAHPLVEPGTQQYLYDLVTRVAQLPTQLIVLPLFERSELSGADWRLFTNPLRSFADVVGRYGMTLCLETSLPAAELQMFLGLGGHSAIRVCYDTGNTTAWGHDVPGDIRRLGQLIAHVHVKDKTAYGENVLLGTGIADFAHIFPALADIGYNGLLICETTRGADPVETARQHRRFVLEHIGGTDGT